MIPNIQINIQINYKSNKYTKLYSNNFKLCLKHFDEVFEGPSELNAITVIVDLELADRNIVNANCRALAPNLIFFNVTELYFILCPINLCECLNKQQQVLLLVIIDDRAVKCRLEIDGEHWSQVVLYVLFDLLQSERLV